MGRTSLLLVITVSISLFVFGVAMYQREDEAAEVSTARYNETRAKNIAASAAEIFVKKAVLNFDTSTSATRSISSVMNGSATVTFTKPNPVIDSFVVRSVGTFGGTRETTVTVLKRGGIPPPILTGAMAISNGSAATIASTGTDSVQGANHDITGLLPSAECGDLHGVTYGSPAPTVTHSGTWSITGNGASPDTEATAAQPNYDSLATKLASLADTTITWNQSSPAVYGTALSPKTVVYKAPGGKASQNISGFGIFIMDLRGATGDMQFNGQLTWVGLVIVIGDPTGNYAAKWTNARPITGALLLTGTTPKWSTTNNLNLHYSCAAVSMAFGNPKLTGPYLVADWWE